MKSGIILLDKAAGVTSRAMDNAVQRILNQKGVGHMGTLDPFATGLLLIAVGKATKYLPYLIDEEKTYEASLVLGEATTTGDIDGEKLKEAEIPELNRERVEEVLHSFLGNSTQVPPMTSAIKKDGVALYQLAHQGKTVERVPRPIVIHDIALLSFDGKILDFRVTVSKGTYIRVLGEDIAKALGTIGYLRSLRRTAIGSISVQKAIKLEDISLESLQNPAEFVEKPIRFEIAEDQVAKVKNGVSLSLNSTEPELFLVYKGEGLAIASLTGGKYKIIRGLF